MQKSGYGRMQVMRKKNYKQFVDNVKEELRSLPVEVTVAGKPFVVVSRFEADQILEGASTGPVEEEKVVQESQGFGRMELCQTCKEDHPAILMEYHSHVKHGV